MVDGEVRRSTVARWRYSVSDNLDASTWAVNLHGFFAGGGVYWRESARLAASPRVAGDQPQPARLQRQ